MKLMTSRPPVDYRSTVNLLKTDFSQRGNLREKEPRMLERWQASGLYTRILECNRGNQTFILHDGPPYANGDIHLGHALNKCLKDFIVRFRLMLGYHSPYVPGWDCHGLPIEQKVIDQLGKGNSGGRHEAMDIRRKCHDYAVKYVGVQREQFKRLGVQGNWETPYLTLSPDYEVGILEAFRGMVERNLVYKGLRPVHWDPVFRTALAEAEIEYNDAHESPSIYVRFPVNDADKSEHLKGLKSPSLVIWTTTPWTLPANLAVALHPEHQYVAYETGDESFVVAEYLLRGFLAECGLPEDGSVARKFKGRELAGLHCAHPLLEKESLVIFGDHVTLEQGTGCVHTAPGHGVEDFVIGKEFGLPVFNPVDDAGCFTSEYPAMEGVSVFDANPWIVDLLKANGRLVHVGKVTHSYPYSWRSHKPVIMRATEQWFLEVDKADLRKRALNAIEKDVDWIPRWGRERIWNMVEGRPDWCLSRQRSWGVPIPSLYDKVEKTSFLHLGVIDRFIEHVRKEGTDCWFTRPVEDFLTANLVGSPDRYEKEMNILDVWFDSGASHLSVLEPREELSWPADLYLEGSDQHRGWFQSSLLVSLAVRDRAPYRAVLTHGFILDEKGEAMSKSKGNVISPLEIIEKLGADVLRLWVASEDYRNDVRVSQGILDQLATAYRRVRNTVRFLLMNISDFDPDENRVGYEDLEEVDRWCLERVGWLVQQCRRAYEEYEFHRVYQLLNSFCVVDLSSLVLDMAKDILYCDGVDDRRRRSAQTALYETASALLRLMAPLLVFTADEAWEFLPGAHKESVHLEDFPEVPDTWRNGELADKFDSLMALREEVFKQIEAHRQSKETGVRASLDARVQLLTRDDPTREQLAAWKDLLRRWFIVSQVHVTPGDPNAAKATAAFRDNVVGVTVDHAEGHRCERCWNWDERVGDDSDHPGLCPRCSAVVRRLTP